MKDSRSVHFGVFQSLTLFFVDIRLSDSLSPDRIDVVGKHQIPMIGCVRIRHAPILSAVGKSSETADLNDI